MSYEEAQVDWEPNAFRRWRMSEYAKRGDLEKIKDNLNDPDIDINQKDENGSTALMFAAWKGDEKVVKLLLKHPKINLFVTCSVH